ncbi:PAS domain-containing protein [Methylophilus methylotrophus]|uniref:PAS domain-containing protein n=1 Tax=Methylophilus methylotrophus TaxID=17 RepID=UPI00037C3551|nr:PAS domain-containing protein [Methylophilus methylotrophus]
MSIFIFSTMIISIIYLIVLGSWHSIEGPFLAHFAILVTITIAIFSAALVFIIQPLFTKSNSNKKSEFTQQLSWLRETSNALSSPAVLLDGLIVKFANTPFLRTLGLVGLEDQIKGMPFTNIIHPADHQIFAELNAEAATGTSNNESTNIRLISLDGSAIPSNVSLTKMREDRDANLTLFQFTPLSAEHTLSSEFDHQFNYHFIIDKLEQIVFQLNFEGKIIFLNPAWESFLEYAIKDSLNKAISDFAHPEDKLMVESRLESVAYGRKPSFTIDLRLISLQGESNWFRLRARSSSNISGERTSVIGTITNIQDIKDAEAQHSANRRAANALLSHIPGMIYRCRHDRSWTFEYVSEGCIDITGYDSLDLLHDPSLTYNLIIHPTDRAAVWKSINQQIAENETFNIIYRIITRKGETKLVQEIGRGVFSSTGELLALEGFITAAPDKPHYVSTLS